MSTTLKVSGYHVKFTRFMLLPVSKEAKTRLPFFSVQCIINQLLDSVFVIFRIIKVSFGFCTITSSFWQKFKQWLINDKNFATIQDTKLTFSIIIGLRPNAFKTKKIHLFFLIARYFIWICRIRDRAPSLEYFSSFVTSFDV